MCRSSKSVDSYQQQPEKSDDYLFLDTVKVESVDQVRQSETEYITLSLNKQDIQLKLDTGAEADSIFNIQKSCENFKNRATKAESPFKRLQWENIPIKAVCTLQCQHKGTIHNLDFFITNIESEPVLSISACKELGLIKFIGAVNRQEDVEVFTTRIKTEYEDVFTGIGCLEKPYHIKLDPTVQPVIIPPRRIPFGLEDRVKTTLLDMCSQGIIVPVDQPTD